MDPMAPVNVGWMSVKNANDYEDYTLELRDDAGRFEEGSHNMIGAHALGASTALLLGTGIDRVWERIDALTSRLEEGLLELGCEVVSPRDPAERSGIISFRRPKTEPADMVQRLAEVGITVASRAEAVRVSPHFYNDESEIDALLDTVANG